MASSGYSVAQLEVKLQQLANQNTQKTFEFNKSEANTARVWQEKMSNSAHQREVVDLKKAGLNPVLSSGGSGAPSYTTSAASGSADSAVNALGNIGSSRISSAAQLQATRISAAATRYAAHQSAMAQISAAREAAAANRYAANMSYQATKYSVDFSKSGTLAGVVDKWTTKTLHGLGIYDAPYGFNKNVAQTIANIGKQLKSRGSSVFTNPQVSAKTYQLTNSGKSAINNALNKLGLSVNSSMRNTFVKAFYFNDSNSQNIINSALKAQRRIASSASTVSRSVAGVYNPRKYKARN